MATNQFILPFLTLILGYIAKGVVESYQKDCERRRDLYSKAFAACAAYKEFPYVIYRRGSSDPESERLRISTDLRQVQKELSAYQAWIGTESTDVKLAFDNLLSRTRAIAGREMIRAWTEPSITSDKEMNMGNRIDWEDLAEYEERFLLAAKDDLRFWTSRWWRRFWSDGSRDAPLS